jgi:hypothetical protein
MPDPQRGTDRIGRRAKRLLSPSQKYEIWLQLLRGETTISEAADRIMVNGNTATGEAGHDEPSRSPDLGRAAPKQPVAAHRGGLGHHHSPLLGCGALHRGDRQPSSVAGITCSQSPMGRPTPYPESSCRRVVRPARLLACPQPTSRWHGRGSSRRSTAAHQSRSRTAASSSSRAASMSASRWRCWVAKLPSSGTVAASPCAVRAAACLCCFEFACLPPVAHPRQSRARSARTLCRLHLIGLAPWRCSACCGWPVPPP